VLMRSLNVRILKVVISFSTLIILWVVVTRLSSDDQPPQASNAASTAQVNDWRPAKKSSSESTSLTSLKVELRRSDIPKHIIPQSISVHDDVLGAEVASSIESSNMKITKALGDRWPGGADMSTDSWKEVSRDSDGSFEASFRAEDGASGWQWYDSEGRLTVEELSYADGGVVTKWFASDSGSENIIQFEKAGAGVQKRYFNNLQEKNGIAWNEEEDQERVDY
jgi:hypothetical protein